MNYAKYRRQTAIISTIGVLVFIVVTTSILIWANGLRFDPAKGTFEQTSVVSVESDLEDVEISLNGKLTGTESPLQIRDLSPGRYEISIEKVGYQTYRQLFVLARGEVGIVEDVDLVAVNPLVTVLPENARFINPVKFSSRLSMDGGELYDGSKLVTRFSIVPLQAHRFSSYYLYQQGTDFRVFIPITNQDFLVYRSSLADYVPINSIPNSNSFVLNEGAVKKLINLSIPIEVVAEP